MERLVSEANLYKGKHKLRLLFVLVASVMCALLLPNMGSSTWASPDQQGTTYPVVGKVLMPDGSPAAGASVEARTPYRGDYKVYGTATADTSGQFKMELPQGEYHLQAVRGTLVYFDYSEALVHVRADGTVKGPLEITLKPGCLVRGRVIDKTNRQPVSGVRILTRDGDHAETAAGGTFSFVLPKWSHTMIAVKEGYYRPIVHVDVASRDTLEILFETKPGGTIKGKITNEKGEPIAGASVGAQLTYFHSQRVKTDANGEYSLPGYDPNARVEVCAGAEGYKSDSKEGIVFPPGQREVTVDFRLAPVKFRSVSGRVTREDGTPIKGALVAYGFSDCYAGYKTTKTNENGEYTLKRVDTTENIVAAQAKGFAPAFKFVEADIDAKADLVMKPGHSLEGKIVDINGNPIEGVWVSISVESDEMARMGFCGESAYRWVEHKATSDKKGRFRLDNLPAGRIFIETYAEGYSDIDRMALEVDRKDHVITLLQPGQISGTVLSAATGRPIKQFKISVDFSSRGTSFSSPDGRFTLSGLAIGDPHMVIAEAPGYTREVIGNVAVKPSSEIDYTAVKFKLRPAPILRGRVVEEGTGKGIEGVLVTAIDISRHGMSSFSWRWFAEPEDQITTRTDAQGRFSIKNIPAKRAAVILEKAGYGKIFLGEVNIHQPVKAAMSKGATITGTVADDSGKPLPGVGVDVKSADYGITYGWAETDASGKFQVTDLPPGEFQVMRDDKDHRTARIHHARVAAGQTYEVNWNRPEEAEIRGTVTFRGTPLADAYFLVYPECKHYFVAVGKTDESGNYRIPIHKAGKYRITTYKGDWTDPDQIKGGFAAVVKPGVNRLDPALPGASISGTAYDRKTGKPLANAEVSVCIRQNEREYFNWGPGWYWQHTEPIWFHKRNVKTDAAGRFEVKNLPDGEALIALEPEGTAASRIPCAIFRLKKDEKRENVIVRVPRLGSAEITVQNAKTGAPMAEIYPVRVNSWGFLFYPDAKKVASCSGGSCSAGLDISAEGTARFSSLPPGRYKVYTLARDKHTAAPVPFDVKPGQTTKTTVKLRTSEAVVFQLKETASDRMPGYPWVGYRISRPGSKKPVLEDSQGPYWGKVRHLFGDPVREARVLVPPGVYEVEAVLRCERFEGRYEATEDLWRMKRIVKVAPGKDTVIEISRNK